MQVAKKTAEYTVYKRADGRYAVKGKDKTFINGDDKVKILIEQGFFKAPAPRAEKSEQEAPSEEVAETEEEAES